MKIEILICTMEDRLSRIGQMFLSPCSYVRYLVSCQYEDKEPVVDAEWVQRKDVRLVFQQGRGLSRNRNNALAHAKGDILLIADDDETFNMDGLTLLLRSYVNNPTMDIALVKVDGMSKKYPEKSMEFTRDSFKGNYYVSSVEMSFRRLSALKLRFNEHFGLGSDYLASGEEAVFVADALRRWKKVYWLPITVGRTEPCTTGGKFLTDVKVQRSKGATFCYLFGSSEAYELCLKEALHYFVYQFANPFKLMRNMKDGIRYCEKIRRWRR